MLIIFNEVMDNAFIGFVSKEELVLVEYFIGRIYMENIHTFRRIFMECELHESNYIGMTTTTPRRLTMHLANDAPKQHM